MKVDDRAFNGFRRGRVLLASMLVGLLTAPATMAGPEDGEVVRGDGTITYDGSTTTIDQFTENLVIDWTSFDVAADETVNFVQPDSTSTALNQIWDQDASQILGAINANGRVILVNPNGIYFGQNASVNVGALIASGLAIDTDDFMAGNLSFGNPDGASGGMVINRGLLQAAEGGSVSLFGGAVSNSGTIMADFGSINLAAGRTVTIDFDGDGLLHFAVDGELIENAHGVDSAVSNTGELVARGGSILMSASSARDVFMQVVNNAGVVEASGVTTDGGRVFLTGSGGDVVNSGVIAANSEAGDGGSIRIESDADTYIDDGVVTATSSDGNGGDIEILGNRVAVLGDSVIDASGATGGGNINIGGAYQGGSALPAAQATVIAPDVRISADATDAGHGGTVIVWADGATQFHGIISARGGANGGDGGFVETSGKDVLQVGDTALVDAGAVAGAAGEWLLDPTDVTISNSADANGGFNILSPDTWEPTTAGSNVSTSTIVSALEGGTSVIITTNDDASGSDSGEAGDITLVDAIDVTTTAGNVTLTLHADNDIIINNSISQSGGTDALGVTLNAAEDITIDGTITVLGGNVSLTADDTNLDGNATNGADTFGNVTVNQTITTNGGNITLAHGSDAAALVTLNADLDAGAGTVSGTATNVQVNSGAEIQDGIDIVDVSTGGLVSVGQGTFVEDLSITTDNLELAGAGSDGAAGTGTTIEGVATQSGFPDTTSSTNIEVSADNVSIHDFHIQSPVADASVNEYSSGVVINGANVEIFNNAFEIRQSGDGSFNGNTSVAIQTVSSAVDASSDVSGLNIHDNSFTFTASGGSGNGYYGIYINPHAGTGSVTIDSNTMTGRIWRGITTEADDVTISNNTITTNTADGSGNNTGIRVVNFAGNTVDNVTISGNTVSGAAAGQSFGADVGLGSGSGETLTDIVITGNTGDINVVNDVSEVDTAIAWDTVGTISLDAGVTIASGGSDLSLTASDLVIDSTAAINGGAQDVTLGVATGTTIELGGTGSTFNLTDAELDTITAGTLTIGAADAGAVTIAGAISPANAGSLVLQTGSTVTQAASATITVAGLGIDADGAVTLDEANDVDTFAADLSGAASGTVLSFTDADGFSVGTVDTLTGITTNNGDVTLTATTGNISLDVDDGGITPSITAGSGAVSLTTSSGSILDGGADTDQDISTTGAVTLIADGAGSVGAAGAGGDVNIVGTGDITIDSANGAYASSDTALTSLTLSLDASGTAAAVISAGSTSVDVGEDGSDNIQVNTVENGGTNFDFDLTATNGGIVLTDNAIQNVGAGNVTLTAAGNAITDSATGTASIITDGIVTLSAATVGTSGNYLDISESTGGAGITLTPATSGAAYIDSVGGTTISGTGITLGGGHIRANSPLTISSDATITADTTFTAAADGTTAGDDLTITNDATLTLDNTSTAITLTLEAGDHVVFDNAAAAGVNVSGTAGQQAHSVVVTADTEGGGADAVVGSVTQTTAGVTTVDNTGDGTLALQVSAGDTIGASGNEFTTNVDSLNLTATAGDIYLNETDSVTLNAVTAGGLIDIGNASGNIDIAGAVSATTTADIVAAGAITDTGGTGSVAGTTVTLTAANGIGASGNVITTDADSLDLSVTGAGDIFVTETDGVNLVDIDTFDGSITVTAGGALTATDVAVGDDDASGDEFISLTSTGAGIAVSVVNAGATGDVTLDAQGGAITDGNGATNNITAELLTADAAGGIDLDTTVASADISTSALGDIVLDEADGIDLVDVDTFDGSITVTAGGALTATDVAVGDDDASDDEFISLTSTGAGIAVGVVNAGTTGDVTLDAQGGAITDGNGATNNITADLLTADAAGGIDLDTTVASANVSTSALGDIVLDEADGIDLVDIDTFDGSIAITTNGATTVTDVAAGDDDGSNDETVSIVAASGNLEIDTVSVTGTGDISLEATNGAITDSDADSSITGDIVTLTADTGIGTAADAINTTATALNLTTTSNAIVINETDGVDLASVSGPTFTLTASGAVTDSGTLAVTGTTTLAAGSANNITLDTASNDFGTVVITSGNNVTLVDTDDITLGDASVSGLYDVTADAIDVTGTVVADAVDFDVSGAAGDITDTGGSLTVAGASLFTVATNDNVILDAASNDFDSDDTGDAVTVAGTATTVTLTDEDAIVLGDINATTFNVTASGTITDDGVGDLVISSTTTLAAGAGNDITLDIGTNDFGTVVITSGNNVTLADTDDITLGNATVSGLYDVTADAITLTGTISANTLDLDASGAAGDISQTGGSLTVTGASTVTAQTADTITLGQAGNDFSSITVSAGHDVTLVDTDALTLTSIAATGAVDVTAGGALTATSVATTGGTDADDISLTGTSVSVATVNAASAGDVSITATTGAITDNTSAVTGDVVSLDASTDIGGTGAEINTTANTLDLATTTGDAFIIEADGVTLGTISIGNDLTLDTTGTGDILVGSVTAGNALDIEAQDGSIQDAADDTTADITATTAILTASGDIGGTVVAGNTNDAREALEIDAGTLTLDASSVVVTDAGAAAATLSFTGDSFDYRTPNDILVDSIVATGSVTLDSSGGSINDADANPDTTTDISGTTVTLQADGEIGGTAHLDIVSNSLSATVASAGNIVLNDQGGTTLADITSASGNVTVNSDGSLEIDTVSASGTVDIATTAGALSDADGNSSISGTTVTLAATTGIGTAADAINTTATALDLTTTSNAIVINETDGVDLAAVSAPTFTLTANGAVTDSGTLAVSGTTTLAAGAANDITLDTASNDFNTVVLTSGNNVTLVDADDITLGNATVSGLYDVTADAITLSGTISANTMDLDASGAAGDISQTGGSVSVTNTATLAAQTTDNITLTQAVNDFNTVVVTSGNNVTLVDVDDISLGDATVSGLYDVTADAITLSGTISANTMDLDASGAAGDISQTGGSVSVTNTSTLTAQTSDNITLGQTGNDFNSVVITSGNDVTLADAGALDLGNSTISGNLDITAGGNVTDSGSLTVAGLANIDTGGNDIVLDDTGNDFAIVASSNTANITLVDTNSVQLGSGVDTLSASGTLNITATGVTQGAATSITGAVDIDSAGADVILTNAGNVFGSSVSVDGNNVSIVDTGNLELVASTVTGDLSVTADGTITDSGVLSVSGSATFDAGGTNSTANAVTLDGSGAGSFFNSVGIVQAGNVTLVDQNAIQLGHASAGINANGTLDVTASGEITDGNAITATTLTLATGGGANITLDDANDVNALSVTSGNVLIFNDIDGVDLAGIGVSSSVTIDAGGTVTTSGATSTGNNGDIAITTSAGGITIGNALTANGAGNVILDAAGQLAVNAGVTTTSGNLDMTGGTGASFSDNGDLSTGNGGTISVSATIGDLVMGSGTAFDATVGGGSGAVSLAAAGNVVLGTVTGGTVDVTASSGAITDVAGDAIADINANTVNLVAATGIGTSGTGGSIDLNATTINATNTSSGGIYLNSVSGSDVTYATIDAQTAGAIELRGDADIHIGSVSGTGSILVEASAGSIFDAADDEIDDITGADIVLSASGNIGGSDPSPGGGADPEDQLEVNASNSLGLTASNAFIDDNSGNELTLDFTGDVLEYDASGNILVGAINAIGSVVLSTDAGYIRDDGADAVDISAASIELNASAGVGDGAALALSSDTIAITAGGSIDVDNDFATAVTVSDLTTTAGSITFDQAGAGSVTFANVDSTADIALTSGAAMSLTDATSTGGGISAAASGVLTVGSVTTTGGDDAHDIILSGSAIDLAGGTISAAGAGDVSLTTTTGSIDDSVGGNSIVADDLAYAAATTVGATNALNTTVAEITSGTAAGGTTLNETDAIVLSGVSDSAGAVNITAGGTITATSVTTTGGTDGDDIILSGSAIDLAGGTISAAGAGDVSLTTTTGSIDDSVGGNSIVADDLAYAAATTVGATNALNTTVAEITSGTAAGGTTLNETDDILLSNVSDSAGAVNITAGGTITASSVTTTGGTDGDDIILNGSAIDLAGGTISAAGAGDVSLTTTTGSIDDSVGGNSIVADDLAYAAATTVGASNALNTTVAEITSGTAAGGTTLNETDDILLSNVSDSGSIAITAGGTINVGSVTAGTIVTLDSAADILDASDDTVTDISAADIVLVATGNIGGSDPVPGGGSDPADRLEVNAGNSLDLTADSAALAEVSGNDTVLDFSGTTIDFTSSGNILVGQVTTTGTTLLDAAGYIRDDGADAIDIDASAVTLTAGADVGDAAALSLASGDIAINANGNVDIDNTFAGAVTVSNIDSGTGSIAFDQSGGGDVAFGSLNGAAMTLTGTAGVSVGTVNATGALSVNAQSISQTGAWSTVGLDLDSAGTITLDDSIASTGAVTVDADGTTTISAAADIVAGASVTFGASGTGTLVTAGDITTSGGAIDFNRAVTLAGDVNFVTTDGGSTGAAVSFGSTLDGTSLLGIDAGSNGDVSFNGAVGSVDALSGIDIVANAVNINNGITTAADGDVTIANSGLLTLAAGTTLDLGGAFTQTGSGAVNLGADIATTGDDIRFAGDVTLADAVSLDTATTAMIEFDGLVTGSDNDLTLSAGSASGVVQLNGQADGLGAFAVTAGASDINADVSAATVSLADTVDLAGNVDITAGGALTIGGDLLLSGASGTSSTLTSGGDAAITLAGTLNSSNGQSLVARSEGDISFTTMTLGSGSADLQVDTDGDTDFATLSGSSIDAAAITLAGGADGNDRIDIDTLTASGDITFAGSLVLASDLNADSSGGNITASGALSGGQQLTLSAANGQVDLQGAVSQDGITISDAASVQFGDTVNPGAGGLDVTSSGDITFDAAVTSSSGGAVTIANTGTLFVNADFNLDGGFTQSGGPVTLAADIITSDAMISLDGDMNVTGDHLLDTGSGAGDILLAGTVTGSGADSLTLASGTGAQQLADVTGLGLLELGGSGNLLLSGAIDTSTFDVSGMSGALEVQGSTSITTADSDINLGSFSGVDASGNGSLLLDAGTGSASLPTVGAVAALDALQVDAGTINLVDTTTTGDQLYNGTVVLAGDLVSGTTVTVNGDIDLAADVAIAAAGIDVSGDIDGADALQLDGIVNVGGAIGQATALDSLQVSGSGAAIDGAITTSGTQIYDSDVVLGGDLAGDSIVFNGSVSFPSGSVVVSDTIDFNGGTSSVTGGGELTLLPETDDASIDIGGTSGVLNLNAAALDGYDAGLVIGGTISESGGDYTVTTVASTIVVNAGIDTGTGELSLISRDGINLVNGTLDAGQLILVAADENGTILNSGGTATSLVSDSIILVAGSNIGVQGEEIRAQAEPGSSGELQIASGAEQSAITDLTNSLDQLIGFDAPDASAIAAALNLAINENLLVTNAAQSSATREQSGGLTDEGFIDPSLFEDIALYEVLGTGIRLPADQSEDGDFDTMPECDPDDEECGKAANGIGMWMPE